MANYTVVGGQGFIGSEIVKKLQGEGHSVFVPDIDDPRLFSQSLGIVVDCAGYGDCQKDPQQVFKSNALLLADMLEKSDFEKLLYVSSTRLYMGQESSSEEGDLTVLSADNRRLFNLTKLVAEELCLKSKRDVFIVRLSNVYGVALDSPLFLPSITRNAITNGTIDMYVKSDYAKDYVSVSDVADACIKLCSVPDVSGEIVNVASGGNVVASDIAAILEAETGCKTIWHDIDFPEENFPVTDISKISRLLDDYSPRSVLCDLKEMVKAFKAVL